MKRLSCIVVSLLLVCAFALSLVSCDEEITHSFATEWSKDEISHWHACTNEGCTEKSDFASHTFEPAEGGLRCTVCAYFQPVAEHEHTFAKEYTYDENSHWHICTGAANCPETSGYAPHAFGNPEVTQTATSITRTYSCVDCAYKKTETLEIQSVVSGESDWKEAFSNLDLVNCSMRITFTENGVKSYNIVFINEESMIEILHQEDDGSFWWKEYDMKQPDGSYANYIVLDNNDTILLTDTSNIAYLNLRTQVVMDLDFSENFESFTYDEPTGSYRCADRIAVQNFGVDVRGDTVLLDTLYFYNIVITVVDGKIDSIRGEYDFGNPRVEWAMPREYAVEYWNIGSTKVVLPQEVKDNAVSETEHDVSFVYSIR